MELIYGPYGGLAKHFVLEINGRKNPLGRTLVVTASANLKNILQTRLLEESSCAAALHFEDFLSLAVKINAQTKEGSKPLLPNTVLQDFIIKNLLRKKSAEDERSYAQALKAAFRDLTSAEVSPADLERLKEEGGLVSAEDTAPLEGLISLYKDYLLAMNIEGFIPYAKALKLAQKTAQESDYLKSFERIIFYGIYDFTSLQFNLLKEICQNYPAQVYFPYEDKITHRFIKNFFEANIYPLAKEVIKAPQSPNPLADFAQDIFSAEQKEDAQNAYSSLPLKIIETSGTQAELESAAKEILRLKETCGLAFKDIALTARTMEPYKNALPNIFEQNNIPLNASFSMPLLEEPLAAFIFNLFTVAKNNFYRDDVLAVLNSPYYKFTDGAYASVIKNIGVSSGLNQWFDLLPLAKNPETEEKISTFLKEAERVLRSLSQSGDFDALAQRAAAFINDNITADLNAAEAQILEEVLQIIKDLSSLKILGTAAKKDEFLEEFLSSLKEAARPKVLPYEEGVNCADIMTLRGQNFKAVIILGLNEGILPAAAAPQAVLKDKIRNLLFTLGFLIHPSADRYEEEKLLFYFALSFAPQATLLYQRSGDDGKPKIPSVYLTRVKNILSARAQEILSPMPRSPYELYSKWPFEFLDKTQAFVLASLANAQDASLCKILQKEQKEQPALERHLGALRHLSAAPSLTAYDGIVPAQNPLWARAAGKGISVSALNTLFQCPSKFLFENITNKEEEIIFERGALDSRTKGNIYHEILENFYKFLKEKDMLKTLPPAAAENIMRDFCASYLSKERNKTLGLYPLLWDVIAQEMKEFLAASARAQAQRLEEDKYEPSFFEQPDVSPLDLGTSPLKLRGKIDRIDISQDGKNYRIIDYKTKEPAGSMEKILFEQKNLQPALYFELAKNLKELAGKTPQLMALEGIESDKKPKTLPYDVYLALKPRIAALLNLLLGIIKEGTFILYPDGDACRYCRFGSLCRKEHGPSLRRARISNLYREIKQSAKS